MCLNVELIGNANLWTPCICGYCAFPSQGIHVITLQYHKRECLCYIVLYNSVKYQHFLYKY